MFRIIPSAYGCEVGSSSIKFIPTGGMYVTGGLTPKNIHFIEGANSPFLAAYYDKGRVKPVLDNVPLYAVMVEDLGVRGAHKCAVLVSFVSLLSCYPSLATIFSILCWHFFLRNMRSTTTFLVLHPQVVQSGLWIM